MIWSTVWVEAVVFTALFTALVMIPTIKHPEIGVHNYPPDIQEEYFKTYEHVPVAPLSGRTIAFKGFGIVLFTVLLTYGAILAGADSFWTGAEFAAILFLIVGAWDTFFLDWSSRDVGQVRKKEKICRFLKIPASPRALAGS